MCVPVDSLSRETGNERERNAVAQNTGMGVACQDKIEREETR